VEAWNGSTVSVVTGYEPAERHFVVRHVPATRCDQCGEAWVSDAQAATVETLVQQARAAGKPVEVIDLAA
jgi:YgiT-type zinc finger domain-containing protein